MLNRPVRHCVAVLALFCLTAPIRAEEPAQQFLDGLMGRGYYDVALDYLEWLDGSSLAPAEFKDALLYLQGDVLISAARYQRDSKIRAQQLATAQQKFGQFLTGHAKHAKAAAALSGMREIQVERARGLMRQAQETDADVDKLHKQAHQFFDTARDGYQLRLKEIREELEALKQGSSSSGQDRETLRAEYLEAILMSATIAYEVAATARDQKKEYESLLKAAGKEFASVAKKYRRWLAGIYSVYYQGRVQQDLGNLKEALTFYEELVAEMNQPDAFRNVAAKATSSAIECWIDPSLKQYDTAIETGEKWMAAARPADNGNPDWLALRLMLARAYQAKAAETSDDDANSLIVSARKLGQLVSRFPGPTQREARRFLAELGGPTVADGNSTPHTFAAARSAAIQTRDELQSNDFKINLLKSKLSTIADAKNRVDTEKQLAESEKQRDRLGELAFRYHHLALELGAEDAPIEQINDLRYYLCYLFYAHGRYYEAAVLGEFLATRYPESSGARTCGNIALASYVAIHSAESDGDSDFVTRRLIRVAEHIASTWPGQPEADGALITLVSFMIRAGRLDEAEAYLQRMPATSARRGEAELRTGQALWNEYLAGRQQQRNAAVDKSRAEELEKLKERSQALLAQGVERMKKGAPSPLLVQAVLALAQSYIDANQAAAAIELLEDPRSGAKALADANSSLITGTPGLAEQTYRIALRGYIAHLPNVENSAAMVARANATMKSLEKTVGNSAEGRRRLVGIYSLLAQDLRRQIEVAPAAERQSLSTGFDTFLGKMAENSNDFNILNWVAATYASMGEGFDEDGTTLSPDAQRYYEKSVAGYEKIVEMHRQGAIKLQPGIVTQVRMRLASAQRRLGAYEPAVKALAEILAANNMMLNVQVEAARALQAGATSGRTSWYDRAVLGDARDAGGKQAIWGWGKISKIAATQMYRGPEYKAKYQDTFYEARLQMAQCQYEQSIRASGTKKKKYLANAKRVLQSTASLYPELGGPKWQQAYEKLMKSVQASLGEPTTGFRRRTGGKD